MSRSFGDRYAIEAGIIHHPEIFTLKLDESHKFIVLGSDGLFDNLKNAEIVLNVAPYYEERNINGAIDFLFNLSSRKGM